MNTFLDTDKVKQDKNGIWISKLHLTDEVKTSQKAWQEIYSFKDTIFNEDRDNFNKTKLKDHLSYIEQAYTFSKKTLYLEIGCGPAYIGEYLMEKYNCHFIGVDFNYPFLVILKKYLDKKGYKNVTLIYADINDMPIKKNSIDFIYGGGVIEHSKNTDHILQSLYSVLTPKGVSFNTVPALNCWWLLRCYYSIPSISPLRTMFEYIHEKILKNRILLKHYGYELSFTLEHLKRIHKRSGFKYIKAGSFAFHPTINNPALMFLGNLYFKLSQNKLFSPMYFIYGKK